MKRKYVGMKRRLTSLFVDKFQDTLLNASDTQVNIWLEREIPLLLEAYDNDKPVESVKNKKHPTGINK